MRGQGALKGHGQKGLPVGKTRKQPQPVSDLSGLAMKPRPVQVWPGSQGKVRDAELNSGQIELLEDTLRKDGTQKNF